jgi:hypothetical protein
MKDEQITHESWVTLSVRAHVVIWVYSLKDDTKVSITNSLQHFPHDHKGNLYLIPLGLDKTNTIGPIVIHKRIEITPPVNCNHITQINIINV